MATKLTLKEINRRMWDSGSSYYPIGELVNTLDRVKLKCKKCKGTTEVLVQSAMRGSPCPHCRVSFLSHDQYLELHEKMFRGKIEYLSGVYTTKRSRILRRCLVCNRTWESPRPLCGCPSCSTEKESQNRRLTHKEYLTRLKEKDNKIVPLEKYFNSNTAILHKCGNGHTFKKSPNQVLWSIKAGCPICGNIKRRESAEETMSANAYLFKTHKLGNKVVSVQGNEPYAIDLLLRKYKPSEIVVRSPESKRKVPTVRYSYKGKARLYFPDIFIPKKNLLIEVKGIYSMGLLGKKSYNLTSKEMFNLIKIKASAVISAGYSFKLYLFVKKSGLKMRRVKLPKEWLGMKHSEFVNWYNSQKGM